MTAAGAGMRGTLDDKVRTADPDRWMSSRFVTDAAARADLIALYALEAELSVIPTRVTQPLLAEMRYTWWAEHLPGAFIGEPRKGHPVLEALARVVARHDLPRAPFDALIEAHIARAMGEPADIDALYVAPMYMAARILSPEAGAAQTASAGRAWGLSHTGGERLEILTALDEANAALPGLPAAAFPAVAHATLARTTRRGPLASRARLLWATMRGRV